MKSLVLKLLAASALTLPLASFAQTANEAVTRAQVRADLINAEQQGTVPRRKRTTRRVRTPLRIRRSAQINKAATQTTHTVPRPTDRASQATSFRWCRENPFSRITEQSLVPSGMKVPRLTFVKT